MGMGLENIMKEKRSRTASIVRLALFVIILLVACVAAQAYDNYSNATNDQGKCAACHSGFRDDNNYTSSKEGVAWGTSLHNAHLNGTDIGSDCGHCHDGVGVSGRTTALSSSGVAADGVNPIGCMGCHGRLEDANTVNQNGPGWGAGLRQQHYGANIFDCLTCHADTFPTSYTPVGEDTLPPWYTSVTHDATGLPMDPCNTNLTEVLAGLDVGLDNDGDGLSDADDPDCSTVSATPGESSAQSLQPLLVTAFDSAAGTMTLSYEAGCVSTDHNLEWGPIGSVATYGYSAQTASECGIGAGGTYVWSFPATPDDIFFLIVGNDGSAEGSLGLDSSGGERPENSGGICDFTQSLGDRCD
jgi:hypothetical protein